MNYLSILDELFSSDSIIFLMIGLVIALMVSKKMNNTKKNLIGFGVCFAIYAVCEILLNFRTNNLSELIFLFVGTIALGGVIGFLVGIVVKKIWG